MKKFEYTITDPVGIHACPAGLLVKAAKALDSTITIDKGGKSTAATKLMAVMGLGVKQGDVVSITVEGGAEEAIKCFWPWNVGQRIFMVALFLLFCMESISSYFTKTSSELYWLCQFTKWDTAYII